MDGSQEQDLFDAYEQNLQENTDEAEQEIAVVDHRSAVLRDVRRYYGRIITEQHGCIDHLGTKLDMLKIISFVLLVLLIIIKFSRGPCEMESNDTADIQQLCMNQRENYNCDKEPAKANPYWKMC